MAKFDAATLDAIEQVAEAFGKETLRRLISRISRTGMVNTRGLIMSMAYEQQTDLASVIHSISFAFEEYGRYHDMRRLDYGSQPPIDKLLDWIEKKGLQAFGKDPNPYKRKPKTDARRRNEIAWGIAMQMSSGSFKRKRRKWFNSEFYANLEGLKEELLFVTGGVVIEDMKASLLERLKSRSANL